MATPDTKGTGLSVPLRLSGHHAQFLRGALETCKRGVESDLTGDTPHPHRERAQREAAAYERLLAALDTGAIVPNDDVVAVVERLAEQTDASNDFEQVLLEHRSLCGLLSQLTEGLAR